MSKSMQSFSILSALALSLALLGGCASTSDVQEARTSADSASTTAAQAMTEAQAARSAADAAQRTANEANRKADAALAETARLREAMERMYERGPAK